MTREEAREILRGWRLPPAVAADPELHQALDLAKSDPDLARWVQEQQDFHAKIRGELLRINAPAGLKQSILVGEVLLRPRFRGSRTRLALVAALVLLLASSAYWLSRPPEEAKDFANFRSRMASFALRTYQMDIVSSDDRAVRDYLLTRGAPADFPLPPGLAQLPVKGGGRLSWHAHPVGMMCFALPGEETAYMFVIDQDAVAGRKAPPGLITTAGDNLSTAAWSDGDRLYLLAAAVPAETLSALVDRR